MKPLIRRFTPLSPVLLVACAATPPAARDFPAGARAPSATELSALLRGKTTSAPLSTGAGRGGGAGRSWLPLRGHNQARACRLSSTRRGAASPQGASRSRTQAEPSHR